MPACDVCGNQMNWGEGYGLSTTQVLKSEAYWNYMFTQYPNFHDDDPHGETLAEKLVAVSQNTSIWLICNQCASLFVFNREASRNLSRKGGESPGPANPGEVAFFAANAWFKLYGAMPQSVESPEKS